MWVGPGLSALSARALPPFGRQRDLRSIGTKGLAVHAGGFPTVYCRFRPFIWRGRIKSRRRINHLAVPPFFSPFKNGENGGNGTASNRRHDSTKIHPALKQPDDLPLGVDVDAVRRRH